MFIKAIEVSNYKSFAQSGLIEFDKGINLIVGENNSGKTALLEAISRRWTSKPHRGPHATGGDVSGARFTYRVCKDDIRKIIDANNGVLLMPTFESPRATGTLLRKVWLEDGFFDLYVYTNANTETPRLAYRWKESEIVQVSNNATQFLGISDSSVQIHDGSQQGGGQDHITPLVNEFTKRVFYVSSNRNVIGPVPVNSSEGNLESNANNLAIKIQHEKNANPTRFEQRYVSLVNRVLPQINAISTTLQPTNVTITVSPHKHTPDDDHVSYLVAESGTGVGHVLAMLYVIVYEKPSVIVIDEPNSFLHPAATRELLRIFRENSQHQYFISTHSTEVFSEVRPEHYTLLSYRDGQTEVSNCTYGDLSETFRLLGISPFYPKVMWVEGETEVRAFPLVVSDPNILYLPLRSADEITKIKKKERIEFYLGVYDKVTEAIVGEPIPAEMKLVVDGEHIETKYREDLSRRTGKEVNFIPRQMFENYLLNAEGIASVIGEELGQNVASTEIEELLTGFQGEQEPEQWRKTTDGAKTIEAIFTHYKLTFTKTKHSVRLTEWVVEHAPDEFAELRDFLQSVFTQ